MNTSILNTSTASLYLFPHKTATINGAKIIIAMETHIIVAVLWGNKYRDAVLVLRMLVFNYLISGTFNMVLGNADYHYAPQNMEI